ncbi:MAG: PIG-L family deacetylase [Lentisphaeria bacterium]|nr:PIG-L family deacetylase [Lentisphaeria bacterium]
MADKTLSILCFGAHPDDCDFRFGGAAMLYRHLGHRVTFVSMTNGDTGHFSIGGGPLARRRRDEALASARIADVEYIVMDIHNGELVPTPDLRKEVIRIMREVHADLVLCHRANDYHPDHRAVGTVVQDAAYTVTVPNVAPLTPHLPRSPVVGSFYDAFRLPNPYVPHVAIDTDEVFERKIDMACCHESQVFEWMPYNSGTLDQVPASKEARREWLAAQHRKRFAAVADSAREVLVALYGEERGRQIRTAETVSISEYGRGLSRDRYRELFPFLPELASGG